MGGRGFLKSRDFFQVPSWFFRGRYLLTRPFRGTSEPGGSCYPTSLRIAAHQRCRGVRNE